MIKEFLMYLPSSIILIINTVSNKRKIKYENRGLRHEYARRFTQKQANKNRPQELQAPHD
jgi:hypothetical protein